MNNTSPQISPSALGVAYLRQVEESISKDSLAKYFTNDDARRTAEGWLKDYPQVARQVALRGRYIEDIASHYIEDRGFLQVVNVAAGLNTFPYRYSHASKLRRYAELDQPQMLDFKKQTISDLMDQGVIKKPAFELLCVPTNLFDEKISASLNHVGWNWNLPTIFIVEGISYYLPANILTSLITDIQNYSQSGSAIIMDYFPDRVQTTPVFKKVMGDIAKDGEPCHTCPASGEIQSLFKDFKIISDRDITDIERDYCTDIFTIDFDAIIVVEHP